MGLRFKIKDEEAIYFITTTTVKFMPVLLLPGIPDIIFENLNFYHRKYNYKLIAYCLMPSHIHLIICVNRETDISDVIRDFNKYTSVAIHKRLSSLGYRKLGVFYNEGKKAKQKFKLWMNRSDKVLIVSENIMNVKINYIHNNPVRAGISTNPEDYPYSSASFYINGAPGKIFVDTVTW